MNIDEYKKLNNTGRRKPSADREDEIQEEFFRVARLAIPQGRQKTLPHRKRRLPHSLICQTKQSHLQIEFQQQVEVAGNRYAICHSAHEAIEVLTEYINNKQK